MAKKKRSERANRPTDCHRQIAALPFRTAFNPLEAEVLLVTSRETRRWVIPKGWPIEGHTGSDAAAIEAFEEAGVIGAIDPMPFSAFSYFKRLKSGFELIQVDVYRLLTNTELEDWPEAKQRERAWFRPQHAAELVQEPGLAHLLNNFQVSG